MLGKERDARGLTLVVRVETTAAKEVCLLLSKSLRRLRRIHLV